VIATRPIAAIEQVDGLQGALDGRVQLERHDLGGQVPLTPRVPTLGIHRVWPTAVEPLEVLWATGNTVYARDEARFLKSTDGGATFTGIATVPFTFDGRGTFLRLASGTLLAVERPAGLLTHHIWRSTDDGTTWAKVHDYRTGTSPLTPSSWCEDGNGHVYYGEYTVADNDTEIRIYRSTDDGATWSVFHAFPGLATADPGKVRHVHSCNLDPVSGRVFFSVGDRVGTPKAGIFRTNAAGDGIEPVLYNDQWEGWPSPRNEAIYPIDIMFFTDYIAWVSDGSPWFLYRMHRDEIGKPSPVVEQVYQVGTPGWGAFRVAADNSQWVVGTGPESGLGLDWGCHLFLVRDEGASIYEMGVVPAEDGSAALTTLGSSLNNDGAEFWFRTRLFTPTMTFKAALCRSTVPVLPRRQVGDALGRRHDPTWSIGLGLEALASRTTGYLLTALGYRALASTTTGARNTAIGTRALESNVTSNDNVAIGYLALGASSGGYQNVAVGGAALFGITTGFRTVAIGSNAGRFLADGSTANASCSHGVFIGHESRASTASRTNEVVIGSGAIGGGSNTVRLGNAAVTKWVPGATNVCSLGDATTAFKELYLSDGTDEWKVTIDTSGNLTTTKV